MLVALFALIESGLQLPARAPARGAAGTHLETEIAHVEAEVDRYEASALAQASKTVPGSPQRIVILGKRARSTSLGRRTSMRSARVRTDAEEDDLVAFMKTLTDGYWKR